MRHYTHLTQEQRYQIAALLKEKCTQKRIAEKGKGLFMSS